MSFDWKSVVGSVAPTLATALGGPMAGVAVKAIANGLGLKDTAKESEVAAAISTASPDILLKLKEVDHAFEIKMSELGVDLEKLAAADRDSARGREIALRDNAPKILAATVVIGWSVINYVLLTAGQPEGLEDAVLYRILGTLDAALMAVLYYYFGSSAGSKEKTQHLADKK